jgi:integrase
MRQPELRQDHRGTWRVRWIDATGRRRSVSFGRDELAALEAFRAWLPRWRRDPTVRTPEDAVRPVRIAEAWARYQTFAARYYRDAAGEPTKEPGILALAMREVLGRFGDRPADSMTPAMLRAVQDAWIAAGLASTTVVGWTHRVRRVWRWLVSEGLARPETAEALRTIPPVRAGRSGARPPKAVKPVPVQLVERTLAALPPSLAAMVRLQLLTGMRPGEVCSMRPADIDASGKLWRYQPPRHKTAYRGHDREILLGPQAQAVLEPFLDREPGFPLFRPLDALRERHAARVASYEPRKGTGDYRRWESYRRRAAEREAEAASRTPSGWTTAAYGRAIADACRRAGLEHWSPNQIRHTVATAIRERHGLEAAQIVLGHARADVTQIYAERSRRLAEDLARSG